LLIKIHRTRISQMGKVSKSIDRGMKHELSKVKFKNMRFRLLGLHGSEELEEKNIVHDREKAEQDKWHDIRGRKDPDPSQIEM